MIEDFFQGYRKVDLCPTEVIVSVFIPLPDSPNFHIFGFKQSRRREDDIAIVNAGMSVWFREQPVDYGTVLRGRWASLSGNNSFAHVDGTLPFVPIVERLVVAYGGIAPRTIQLREFMTFWEGKPWTFASLLEAIPILQKLTELASNTPGGQVLYRMRLARNFFLKFFFQVAYEAGLSFPQLRGHVEFRSLPDLLKPFLNQSQWTTGAGLYPLPCHPTYQYHKAQSKGLQVGNEDVAIHFILLSILDVSGAI